MLRSGTVETRDAVSRWSMKNERVRVLVEIALCVALSAVLNLPGLRIRLPINIAGGTVSLSMLPIFVLALRRGVGPAMVAGAMYGLVDVLVDPFVVHPVQFLLDYPVGYALVGLAGIGAAAWRTTVDRGQQARARLVILPFLLLGAAARLSAHWLSGVIFFGANAPSGQPVWLYSLVYNASYVLPSLIFSAAAAVAVLPVLERAVPSSRPPAGAKLSAGIR
jgi:thiamine transporter